MWRLRRGSLGSRVYSSQTGRSIPPGAGALPCRSVGSIVSARGHVGHLQETHHHVGSHDSHVRLVLQVHSARV